MSLEGQRVVVVGGSSGIGFAVARRALREGALVTIGGRSEARLRAAADELGGVEAAVVDIADEASIGAFFEPIAHVDHLVICAGTVGRGHVVRDDLETLRAVVDQRLWGAIHAVRAAAPKLVGGSITFTSGGIADRPRAGRGMYTVALAAVEALPRALALELAPTRVNCITPGAVATPLQGTGPDAEARLAEVGRGLPVGRVGEADDLAQAYLMVMNNGYLNGEVIHVDGGGRYA